MAQHNELGAWGEQLAAEFLITKGYTIVDRNWRLNRLEVDIVATIGDRVVFVEVKTRSTDFVDPRLAINRKRMMHLVNAADAYVRMYNVPHSVQFDVIIIIGVPGGVPPTIEHIPDAFLPPRTSHRHR